MHKNNLKSNHYLHWGQISSDPNHPDVRAHLRAILRARYRGRVESTKDFLKDFVRGYSVLDIGAVAHSLERAQSPAWKHNVIRSVATKVTGVDIVEEAVNALVTQGLDLRCIDATSEVDMGDRFERVVIGDVIEHVDSPVKLLQFAMRHLTPQGQILCTTPNPFFIMTLKSLLVDGMFIPNAEHVSWISPTMALELAHRAGLTLDGYWHTQGEGKTPLRSLGVKVLDRVGLRDSELFSGCFYYVFRLDESLKND